MLFLRMRTLRPNWSESSVRFSGIAPSASLVSSMANAGRHTITAHWIRAFRSMRTMTIIMRSPSTKSSIKTSTAQQIETVDMARRALHNEAAEMLMDRLDGKIAVDFDTARRLFTLICVLHIKG